MTCSKKNWAYTFLGFGGTFLVLGVVLGFVIAKIVIGVVEDKACVDSVTDSNFKDWMEETSDSVITKLYYWDITNKDGFLYKGELPMLRERGPYVYKQSSQPVGVSFDVDGHTRTSQTWKKKAKFFKDESCKDCKEDDQLNVLNVGYLALMNIMGGDEIFANVYFPHTIPVILQQFNNDYEKLGNTKTEWRDPLGSSWTNPGFGAWLHQTNNNKSSNFTSVQMKGLYGVLGNSTLLFGETDKNTSLIPECEWNKSPARTKCGFLLQMKAVAAFTKANQTNSSTYSTLVQMINGTLCPNSTSQCFNRLDLLESIFLYVLHVKKYTMWVFLGEKFEIVTTMSQKNLSLGYHMGQVRDHKNKTIYVPGMVVAHSDMNDAKKKAKKSTFYTCEAGDKKYQWAAFDGKKNISLNPDVSLEDSIVEGYSLIVPRSETADRPCKFSHELSYNKIEIFVSVIAMQLKVRYDGETSLHGLELKRFTPRKEDYLRHSGVKQGFVDFSVETKAPSYLSFAHLLYTNVTVPKSFNQTPNVEKHQSIMDIEAVTGMIARGFLRLQLNAPILKNFVKEPRIKGRLNISYLAEASEKLYLKSIPVLWGEYGGQASEDNIDTIKKKVIGTLGLSCGILIGLPVLGCVFIIVAAILFVINAKANQISEIGK